MILFLAYCGFVLVYFSLTSEKRADGRAKKKEDCRAKRGAEGRAEGEKR
jgi:hypothetical protein